MKKRQVGVQAISGNNDTEFGMICPDFMQQPFTGISLAILFRAAVNVPDRLRSQRNDLPHIGMDNSRADDLMGIIDDTVFQVFSQAAGAGDGRGREILCAVNGDEILAV